jgi:hypothetical protein
MLHQKSDETLPQEEVAQDAEAIAEPVTEEAPAAEIAEEVAA